MINKVALQGPNGMNLQSLTKAEPTGQAENTWNVRIQTVETVEISLGGKSLQHVDGLEKELADIFGASSFDEFEAGTEDGAFIEEEEALFQEIDALVTKNMSASELKNFNHIHREIDRIFSDDQVTEQEEALLEKLDERLESGKGSGCKPGKSEKNLDAAFGDIMGRQQAGGVTRSFLAVFQEQKDLLF